MATVRDFDNEVENQWCPGCPNHAILLAVKKAFAELGRQPNEVCLVSGIGQAAKLPHYLKCNLFNGLHGRALPVATGIAAANPGLTVLVATGDGDCYGEGGNHFLHAIRRNPDITVLVHDNTIYALTKGQASPTTPLGVKRTLQAAGVTEPPLDPVALAIGLGCGFVARGFAGHVGELAGLLVRAMRHPGFSLVDVVQPCITWDPHPMEWYRDRIVKLPEGHDPSDRDAALALARKAGETLPVGIYFQGEPREVFGDGFRKAVSGKPLAELPGADARTVRGFFRP